MEGKMKEIEMKIEGLQKAFLSLSAGKDLQALLDFSTQNPCTKLLQNEKSGNSMREKLKGIDLNDEPCEDLAQVLEIEGKKLTKRVGRDEGLADAKLEEIEGKMREMEFCKSFIEERAKELQMKQRDIEDSFGYLEVKKMEFARKRDGVDAKFVEIEEQKLKLEKSWEKLKTSEKEVERVKVLCEQRFEEIARKVREVDSSRQYIETYANGLELKRKELDIGFEELESKWIELTQMTNTVAAIYRSNAEKYAEELELKRKELVNGFKGLESKNMEFTQKAKKIAAIILSNAEKNAKELELKRKEFDNGFKELESKKMKFAQKTSKFGPINLSNADINMNQTKRKRSSYDLRCRTPERTKHPAPQVCRTVINDNSDSSDAFWTCCTSCKYKFMYHKNFVNKVLKCRNCSKNFTGYELDAESITPDSEVHSVITDVNVNQMKTKGYTCAEGSSSLHGSDETIEQQVSLVTVATSGPTRAANVINESESNQNRGSLPTAEFVDCPYSELSEFDQDEGEKCFSVDQIWACYDDSLDVLPMLYGHIRKVFSPNFKLQVTFLKANPEEQNKINWVKAGLPMVCGKFIHDDTIETSKRFMFSHQMHYEKVRDDGTYLIYPQKGETWALFKDWNIGWSSDPANHRTFKYVMVEILADFKQENGVEICYLVKVKGFESVFRRVAKNVLIPPSEMLRFAYSVPSSKLTGAERGVPAGAFELDPCSLPIDPDKLCQPEEMEADA